MKIDVKQLVSALPEIPSDLAITDEIQAIQQGQEDFQLGNSVSHDAIDWD